MPQMSPLWWFVFPVMMVMIVIVLVANFYESLMHSGEMLMLGKEGETNMWW